MIFIYKKLGRLILTITIALSLLACGSGGGGSGGGSSDTGNTDTNNSNFVISGKVTTSSGSGIIGVSLELIGASSASTTSDSSGQFSFTGLINGTYTLTPSKSGYAFTPVNISLTIDNANLAGLEFIGSVTSYSTTLISAYMGIQHSQEINNFIADEEALSRQLRAQGLYKSGYHYTESKKDYIKHVQAFVDNSLVYINQVAQTMLIDKTTLTQLLTDYQTSDYSYANTYYSNVDWGLSGSGLLDFLNEIKFDIDNIYSAAKLQLAAL